MKRATTAAVLAALLVSGSARAQEEGEGPAVKEPEQSGAEVVTPPPAAPPADGKGAPQSYETYTVKPGDTLWDISQRQLGNPWYWPKVWSYNPEIENPHWIYPGNNIRFYPAGDEMPAQVEADGGDLPSQPTEVGDFSVGSINGPEQLTDDDDVVSLAAGTKMSYTPPKRTLMRQEGLVTQRELDDAGIIEKSAAAKEMLDNYEKVYLRFRNRSAVRLGERYSVFRTAGVVTHPVTGSNYGYLTHVIGSLRIVAIDQHYVTGMIDATYDSIERGDFVAPLGNFQKNVIAKDATRKIEGVILSGLRHYVPTIGESHFVFIDKGSRDGVEEGNSFVVLHRGDPLYGTDSRFPNEVAGAMVVVDVKETASMCLVTRSAVELAAGDRVTTQVRSASR